MIPAESARRRSEVRRLALRRSDRSTRPACRASTLLLSRDTGAIFVKRDQHDAGVHQHQHAAKMWEASGVSYAALVDR